jgi:pimeloyl-ACP methyl ester carboxylesterase
MVDVGGYQLSALVEGDGPTTVVWLTGIGEPGSNWARVLDRLTVPTDNLVYDRAGIGTSEPIPDPEQPRPYSHFADELARLLAALDIEGGVVLVGHSFGGNIARVFTRHHQSRVRGLVLVESSKPYLVLWPGDDTYRADGDGSHATRIDFARGGDEVVPLNMAVPAVVLTRTPGRWSSPLATDAVDQDWRAAHCQLAADLGAPHILAADGGHRLNAEAPGLVALAVDAVVNAVTGTPLHLDPNAVSAAGGQLSTCPHTESGLQ